jgi:hypothetical protein
LKRGDQKYEWQDARQVGGKKKPITQETHKQEIEPYNFKKLLEVLLIASRSRRSTSWNECQTGYDPSNPSGIREASSPGTGGIIR